MRPIISRSFIKKSFSNRSFFKVTAFLLAAGALPALLRCRVSCEPALDARCADRDGPSYATARGKCEELNPS